MGKVEFRLDGIKAKLFELEAEFGDLKKLDALAAELDGAIAEFDALGIDPDELEARARSFRTLADRRAADLAAVDADREALEARAAAPVTPIAKDPLVVGGAAGAAVCLVAGLWLPAIAAGAVAGLGAAAFGVLRDSQAAARRREALAGLAALDERVQAIEKRFEIESRAIRAAQEALGVSGPEGVLERVEAYRTLKARRQSVRERREALGRQKDFAAIEAERARLLAEVSQLEEELRGFGATAAFDPGELRRELAALEGRAGPQRVAAAGAALAMGSGVEGDGRTGPGEGPAGPRGAVETVATAGAYGPLGSAFEAWLDAAARVLGDTREAVAREVLLRVQPLVAPLTVDRHRSVAFDADGHLVVVGADGQVTPAASLSPATQDALYLALRLTGFAVVARERPWPLLLDDPLGALDDARLAAACRALRATARAGQIVHFAARKLPPALADKAQALA